MQVYNLPDDLNLNNISESSIYHYRSSKEIYKQYVNLNMHTFSFLKSGEKEVFASDSVYKITPTHFLLMRSGHCLMTERTPSDTNTYESTLLFFSNHVIKQFIKNHNISTLSNESTLSVHAFKYDPFIQLFVKSLNEIMNQPQHTKQRLLNVKLEEILLYLVESYGTGFLSSMLSDSDNRIQSFITTIEQNQLNKLSLHELSFLCNMSISTFKREFKKHFLKSPMKWFQEKRLEHARYLITHEQKRPSDIFLDIGYESLSSFIHAYKEMFGVTPKQHI